MISEYEISYSWQFVSLMLPQSSTIILGNRTSVTYSTLIESTTDNIEYRKINTT